MHGLVGTDLLGMHHRVTLAVTVGGLIVLEAVARAAALRKGPSIPTTVKDATIFSVDLVVRGFTLWVRLAVFSWIALYVPWRWAPSVLSIGVAYVSIDFIYYWKHRLFHATSLGWALHSTHHSSRELNFLATFRVNWLETLVSYFFFLPLTLLGLPPILLFFLVEVNDGWQFVCHTEFINRWRWLDRYVNTPNIHRVHHARDRRLADRNYGSTFMLWDRLFGTYHPGLPAAAYGISGDRHLKGVLGIQFGGLATYLSQRWQRTRLP